MDPDAAWLLATDPQADMEERADAAAALIEWIGKGGHLPRPCQFDGVEPMTHTRVHRNCAEVLAIAWSHR